MDAATARRERRYRSSSPAFSGPPLREMSAAGRSMYLFGFYVIFDGLFLVVAPQLALRVLGLGEDGVGWLRVMGMVVAFLGWYYLNLAKLEVTPFFRITTHTRMSVPFVLGAFVLAGWVPPVIIAFAIGDFAGGLWTWLALRKDAAAAEGRR